MKIQFFKLILILSSSMVMSQTSLAGDGGLRFAEKNQEIAAQIQAKKKNGRNTSAVPTSKSLYRNEIVK